MNPFDTSVSLATTPSGEPGAPVPDVDTHFRYFPMKTHEIVDKIIVAPDSPTNLPNQIVDALDDLDIAHQFGEGDGIDIVDSQYSGNTLDKTHGYGSEFSGAANYKGTIKHLNEEWDNFLRETDPSTWPVVYLVQLDSKTDNTVIEAYRHPTVAPEASPDSFGHDEFQDTHTYRIHGNCNAGNYLDDEGFNEDDVDEY